MRNLFVLASLALLPTTACSTTDSSDLLTHGMYGAISASTTGDGKTTVSATLYEGNPINLDFVDLTGDDRLVASFNGESKTMSEFIFLNIVSHTATFDSANPGDEFHVAFERSLDDGAPDSWAVIPEPFEVTPPPPSLSRADGIDIPYGPSGTGDPVYWSARGTCIDDVDTSLPGDTGTIQIAANTFKLKQGSTETTCQIDLEVHRTRDGHIDPAYGKGGDAIGQQVRKVSFTSTP